MPDSSSISHLCRYDPPSGRDHTNWVSAEPPQKKKPPLMDPWCRPLTIPFTFEYSGSVTARWIPSDRVSSVNGNLGKHYNKCHELLK
ncbi:hypothetical protein PBY51_005614 [Eleginops maclovinus]|uniref:Uncharacterized protein n=1 Tax=Eleginops maclovinus TaxID=56733 RepID=A0AAN7X6L4_ELEMC|nr:hypothetical protein PBY51_005614 [Eleginops maclovinus]